MLHARVVVGAWEWNVYANYYCYVVLALRSYMHATIQCKSELSAYLYSGTSNCQVAGRKC